MVIPRRPTETSDPPDQGPAFSPENILGTKPGAALDDPPLVENKKARGNLRKLGVHLLADVGINLGIIMTGVPVPEKVCVRAVGGRAVGFGGQT